MIELSLLFARFWGIVFVVLAVAIFLNQKSYVKLLKKKLSEEFVLLSGLVALLIGAVQVSVINSWTFNYLGILTVIGWISLIKGIVRLTIPSAALSFRKLVINPKWMLPAIIVCLGVGTALLYAGFLV